MSYPSSRPAGRKWHATAPTRWCAVSRFAACPIAQLVDPQPAIARCDTLLDRLCGHLVTCGAAASLEGCRMQASSMFGIDCAQALSATLNYEPCLDALQGLACTAQLPSICRGVIGVLPPATG